MREQMAELMKENTRLKNQKTVTQLNDTDNSNFDANIPPSEIDDLAFLLIPKDYPESIIRNEEFIQIKEFISKYTTKKPSRQKVTETCSPGMVLSMCDVATKFNQQRFKQLSPKGKKN